MNHKRGKPKSRRSGCLHCKGWKHQREAKAERFKASERRKLQEPVKP